MTFPQFLQTMTYATNLAEVFPDAPKGPGLVYAGFAWIARNGGRRRVYAGSKEFTGTLHECEKWLWENYAKAEVKAVTP